MLYNKTLEEYMEYMQKNSSIINFFIRSFENDLKEYKKNTVNKDKIECLIHYMKVAKVKAPEKTQLLIPSLRDIISVLLAVKQKDNEIYARNIIIFLHKCSGVPTDSICATFDLSASSVSKIINSIVQILNKHMTYCGTSN